MTTILGVEGLRHATLVADGLTTGSDNRRYTGPGMEKIATLGPYLIAAAGPGAACDAAITWTPPTPPARADVDFIRSTFVPALRAALEARGAAFTPSEDSSLQLLVALQGRIYKIDTDGTVVTHQLGRYAIGSGAGYAIGALAAGASPDLAMQIAADNDVSTSGPFQTATQRRPTAT